MSRFDKRGRGAAFPKIYFNVAEISRRRWLEEGGQRLENVDRTHLVLASGKLVLQKEDCKCSITLSLIRHISLRYEPMLAGSADMKRFSISSLSKPLNGQSLFHLL